MLGFVGVGALGGAIARRLVELGHPLIGYDIDAGARDALARAGGEIADSAREVADRAEIVFACLPAPEISERVAAEPDGIGAGGAIEIYVELSTLGIPAIEAIAAGLAGRGIAVLDNPVVGGAGGSAVAAGRFATISAGPRAAFDRVQPLLAAMTNSVFYVGEKPGLAQVCKVVNNAIGITGLTIACEAMVMGVKAGLDARVLLDVVNAGSGRNVATEEKFPRSILPRRFDGGPLAIGLKDLKLYVETVHGLGLPSLLGSHVMELWQAAEAEEPGRGYSSIVQLFEKYAGVEVKG